MFTSLAKCVPLLTRCMVFLAAVTHACCMLSKSVLLTYMMMVLFGILVSCSVTLKRGKIKTRSEEY